MTTDHSLDEGAIRLAAEAAQRRVDDLGAEHERIGSALSSARHELQLLEQLLELRSGKLDSPSQPPRRHAGQALEDAVVAFLEEQGAPVHVNELMEHLAAIGVDIPGAGTQANLISRLRRDERIVRPQRGFYGLASLGVENAPAQTHKKRRTKKRR